LAKKTRRRIGHKPYVSKWFRDYKNNQHCAICGEDHVSCLTFHHKDPDQKEITISMAVRKNWKHKELIKEIKKCSVLCMNCHAKLHWEESHKKE